MTQILQSPGITLQNTAHTVIPQIGFGTFQIPPEDTQRAVEEALESVTVTSILQPLTTTRNKSAMHCALLAWPTKYG